MIKVTGGLPYRAPNDYLPYSTNMETINNNFNHVVMLNTNLSTQIGTLNADITQNNQQIILLQHQSDELKNELKNASQSLIENTAQMVIMRQEMNGLLSKINKIFEYIPKFVKQTSTLFVKLLYGIKTNTVGKIFPNVSIDNLLENSDNLIENM